MSDDESTRRLPDESELDELSRPADPDGLALAEGRLGGAIPAPDAREDAGEEAGNRPRAPTADSENDLVDEEDRESFPASDPPSSWAGEEGGRAPD